MLHVPLFNIISAKSWSVKSAAWVKLELNKQFTKYLDHTDS